MGKPHSMHGTDEQYVWLESLKRRDHSEEPGVDGRTVLKQILAK
jgi:hypothetical protein